MEAQRREAAGADVHTAYDEVHLWCPTFHDTTPLPPGTGNPFERNPR